MKGGFCFFRFETLGALGSCVSDFAIFTDDVEPVGPALIGSLGGVLHVIHEDGDFEAEVFSAVLGSFFSFREGFVSGDEDAFSFVDWNLPAIGGVGFANVDDEEFGFGLIGAEPTVQFIGVLPERGSGVRAEDENDGLFGLEIAEFDKFVFAHSFEVEIGG
jgi:hypothetical protein